MLRRYCKQFREKNKIELKAHEEKSNRDKAKHPMLNPCSCKKARINTITEINQKNIHEQLWSLPYNDRVHFFFCKMIKNDIKRRKKDTKGFRERKSSFNYLLPDTNGRNKGVCQRLFLNMLGFNKWHRVLQTISMKSDGNIFPSADMRGKNVPTNKFLRMLFRTSMLTS